MSGRTHIAGGLLFGSIAVYAASVQKQELTAMHSLCFLAGCSFGSLLCDIDQKDSIIGRKLWPISFLFHMFHAIFRILSCLFPKKSRIRKNIEGISRASAHRGMMHWPATTLLSGCMAFALLHAACRILGADSSGALQLLSAIPAGITIGMASHLVYDFVSGRIAPFAPLSNRKIGIPLVKTCGFSDKVIVRTLSLLGAVFLLFSSLTMHLK